MNQDLDGNKGVLFYDTYALYAIVIGDNSYQKYSHGWRIVTTLMHLYELYYTLIKEGSEDLAETVLSSLSTYCVGFSSETIKRAAHFRMSNSKKKFSYIDCLGYAIARERNISFLTGDQSFKDVQHVQFVKESR